MVGAFMPEKSMVSGAPGPLGIIFRPQYIAEVTENLNLSQISTFRHFGDDLGTSRAQKSR